MIVLARGQVAVYRDSAGDMRSQQLGLGSAEHSFAVLADPVAAIDDRRIATRSAVDDVAGAIHRDDAVAARSPAEAVGIIPARESVVAGAAVERVAAAPALQLVIAGFAEEAVLASATVQQVVAGAAEERVVAALALEVVADVEADDDIVAVTAEDQQAAWLAVAEHDRAFVHVVAVSERHDVTGLTPNGK